MIHKFWILLVKFEYYWLATGFKKGKVFEQNSKLFSKMKLTLCKVSIFAVFNWKKNHQVENCM